MPEHASNASNALNDPYDDASHSDFFDLAGVLEQRIEGIRRSDFSVSYGECRHADSGAFDVF